MPTDAYWAVACAFMALAVLAMWLDRRHLQSKAAFACSMVDRANEATTRWKEAYEAKAEQLEATRIALREAQKNDHRDARGRFVKAS